MSQDTIVFQMATHYLPKVALRLECLFVPIEEACKEKHPIIHHYALLNILEIIKLAEKPELKSRFLKEFMRIEHASSKHQTVIPDQLYAELFLQIQQLNQIIGRFGDSIHQDLFLQSIRLNQASQQSDGELHSPQLLLWLDSKVSERQHDLIQWLQKLKLLYQTVAIYLALLRSTAVFKRIQLNNGFYQCSLPLKSQTQLILLRMNKHQKIIPRIQLGHHGLSLRLCEAHTLRELEGFEVDMDLAICQV